MILLSEVFHRPLVHPELMNMEFIDRVFESSRFYYRERMSSKSSASTFTEWVDAPPSLSSEPAASSAMGVERGANEPESHGLSVRTFAVDVHEGNLEEDVF